MFIVIINYYIYTFSYVLYTFSYRLEEIMKNLVIIHCNEIKGRYLLHYNGLEIALLGR